MLPQDAHRHPISALLRFILLFTLQTHPPPPRTQLRALLLLAFFTCPCITKHTKRWWLQTKLTILWLGHLGWAYLFSGGFTHRCGPQTRCLGRQRKPASLRMDCHSPSGLPAWEWKLPGLSRLRVCLLLDRANQEAGLRTVETDVTSWCKDSLWRYLQSPTFYYSWKDQCTTNRDRKQKKHHIHAFF